MPRSVKKGPFIDGHLAAKIQKTITTKSKIPVKTWSRRSTVIPDAIGITLGSPNSVQPDLGFEFRLTRTADSVGYQSAITDNYSVFNMRLDIRPITIRRPLYQYK